jgi:UDP-N-acetyl-D-galactosamine dehydrogenase
VLGMTFKENCPDLRNTKVIDIVAGLRDYGQRVSVHDPYAAPEESLEHYGEPLLNWDALPKADAIVLAVSHRHYLQMPVAELLSTLKPGGVVIDVKSALNPAAIKALGFQLWRL